MIANPPSSFPFLRVAMAHNVPYAAVLWLVEAEQLIDSDIREIIPQHLAHHECFASSRWHLMPWSTATSAAAAVERLRRGQAR